jgi:hypothetical protein
MILGNPRRIPIYLDPMTPNRSGINGGNAIYTAAVGDAPKDLHGSHIVTKSQAAKFLGYRLMILLADLVDIGIDDDRI